MKTLNANFIYMHAKGKWQPKMYETEEKANFYLHFYKMHLFIFYPPRIFPNPPKFFSLSLKNQK